MDIETMRNRALQGNEEACLAMGRYELDSDPNGERVVTTTKKALEWYQIAANKNNIGAIRMMVACNEILYHAMILACLMDGGGYDTLTGQYLDEILEWGKRLKSLTRWKSEEKEIYKSACKSLKEANYYQGLCIVMAYYFDSVGDERQYLSKIKELYKGHQSDPRVKVIQGITIARLDLGTGATNRKTELKKIKHAVALLKNVEKSSYYKLIETGPDEFIAAVGATTLSVLYRLHPEVGNIAKAYKVLKTTGNHVENERATRILDTEMAKYKKSMFKGYQYIDN